MNIKALQDLQKKQPISIIDVREKEAFDALHIATAQNLPLDDIDTWKHALDKKETHYIVCQKGIRSQKAAAILNATGIHAISIEDGMDNYIE